MYWFYGKINRGQVSRPLYRGCPLFVFGGSVIKGFTVVSRTCICSGLQTFLSSVLGCVVDGKAPSSTSVSSEDAGARTPAPPSKEI